MPLTPPLIPIDNPDDPRLADFRHLTDADLRAAQLNGQAPFFIAESEGVVRHLIDSPFPIRSILATHHHATVKMADVLGGLDPSIPIYTATESIIESITGFTFHRGVIACATRCPEPPLASILAQARTLVICEDLSNIENLGAVFRNLACLIASPAAVLLAGSCCNPLNRRTLRVSMGHALRIPFATVEQWPASMEAIHAAGFTTYAMTPRPEASNLREVRRGERTAIILGAEGPGLKDQTINASSHRIRIPMSPGSDSLNVATALAVALWQLA
ncbi:MAG: RNA methyltransferase [Planctomycetota bacterium]|nr:RNA methyltransferase [Planctomycetota bacterium]